MKKVLSLILALVLLIGSVALADIDLTGMSFNELRILYEQVQQALINTKQGGTVKVGSGLFIVGKDIPSGKWSITAEEGGHVFLSVYKSFDETRNEGKGIFTYDWIYSPSHRSYDEGDTTEMTVYLQDGYCVEITSGSVLFTPANSLSAGFFD